MSEAALTDHTRPPIGPRAIRIRWVAIAVFAWWVVDINLQDTILMTPIDTRIRWTALMAGLLSGCGFGYELSKLDRSAALPAARRIQRRALVFIMCSLGMFFGAVIADQLVWRTANLIQFAGARSEVSVRSFPIREVFGGRGGPRVSIGSRGELDRLHISPEDYRILAGQGRPRRPWIHCLKLLRETTDTAVRVWLPSRHRLTSKQRTVSSCPASVRWI
ncbi:hypothetical protein OLX23_21270 [Novosphingobium sp. JCM 18896]|nr:hypothetical protein [Novosphingobium sp. JCM 18896]